MTKQMACDKHTSLALIKVTLVITETQRKGSTDKFPSSLMAICKLFTENMLHMCEKCFILLDELTSLLKNCTLVPTTILTLGDE